MIFSQSHVPEPARAGTRRPGSDFYDSTLFARSFVAVMGKVFNATRSLTRRFDEHGVSLQGTTEKSGISILGTAVGLRNDRLMSSDCSLEIFLVTALERLT